MGVSSISIKNYKAFKEGKIDLKPITVLLGANSLGKSSLLKLILLLSQTAGANPKPEHVIKLLGKFVDFGESENLFHKKDTKRTISLKFNLDDIKPFRFKRYMYFRSLKNALMNSLKAHTEILNTLELFYSDVYVHREFKNHSIRRDILSIDDLDALEVYLNSSFKSEVLSLRRKINKLIKNYKEDENLLNKEELKVYESYNFTEFIDTVKVLKSIEKIELIDSLEFNIISVKNKLLIRSLSVFNNEEEILRIDLWNKKVNKKSFYIKSKYVDQKLFDRYLPKFRKSFSIEYFRLFWNRSSVKFDKTSSLLMTDPFPSIVLFMLSEVINKSIRSFNPNKVRHVSPIRAYPKRYYFVDSDYENNSVHTSEHNFLPLYLKSSKKNEVEFINTWLKKFGIEVSIEELKEIIQSIKIQQNGIKLDLLDVGFGISQILPVIIQSISSSNDGVIVIEQPEIHIHPKMQSELADFFIHLANTTNKKFIIETHSESFLKRLRRRMAENRVALDESISVNDVGIHFIEKSEDSNFSIIKNIDISKTGDFDWPKDFYSSDMDDTINFLKYQD